MKVIKPDTASEPDSALLARLAAAMLNLEHGALVYGETLQRLDPPHLPHPVVEIPPLTTGGLSCQVHYRPAVGVVWYTRTAGTFMAPLLRRLVDLLDASGLAHLAGSRAVAATPHCVFRGRAPAPPDEGTRLLAGPTGVDQSDEPTLREVRLVDDSAVLWTEIDSAPPPPSGAHAVFTWHFIPACALTLFREEYTLAQTNAIVASVLFDAGRVSALPDLACPDEVTGAFKDIPLPRGAEAGTGAGAEAGAEFSWVLPHGAVCGADGQTYRPWARGFGGMEGAFLLSPDPDAPRGTTRVSAPLPSECPEGPGGMAVAFVGIKGTMRLTPRGTDHLPQEAWDPLRLLRPFECVHCAAPIGGEAVVVREPQHPEKAYHHFGGGHGSGPLLADELAGLGCLLCRHCWSACSDYCLRAHMGARLSRTVLPMSQAEASLSAESSPGEGLASLLAGRAFPVEGVPGAFVIWPGRALGGPGPAPTGPVLLAGDGLGYRPELRIAELAALGLPTISGLRLAEARPARK